MLDYSPTVRGNVFLCCRAHNLPLELAVYFLTLIKLAGGDDSRPMPHPDEFMALILQISREIGTPMHAEEVEEIVH